MEPFSEIAWGWDSSSSLFVLTGAGISAESNLKTFRDAGGLWEGHRVEDVATPEAFDRDPEMVIRFYNERRAQLKVVEPNAAHSALGELQAQLGDRVFILTQNVDNLHERGGANQVLHMHGELQQIRCSSSRCDYRRFEEGDQTYDDSCPQCAEPTRPDIVWFGEIPYEMDYITERLQQSTHFVYIGTSSVVYPAAGLKQIAKRLGLKVLTINTAIDLHDLDTDFYMRGKAGEMVPGFVSCCLS